MFCSLLQILRLKRSRKVQIDNKAHIYIFCAWVRGKYFQYLHVKLEDILLTRVSGFTISTLPNTTEMKNPFPAYDSKEAYP